jgi:phosphoribosylformimino-5-aminoimidazole carboxamide ribotide isomerase
MELIPAIDLLDGKVVRLRQGSYDDVTVYAIDPAEQARAFADAGALRLHVVDLDGARDGMARNVTTVERILRAAPTLAVQVGGGIRTSETAERWLAAGAARVGVGTAAVKQPEIVREIAATGADRVVVAIDARADEVAVEGWVETTAVKPFDLACTVDGWGVGAILFTSIARDGMGTGPDVARTAALQRRVTATVIASGGIGTVLDVLALAEGGVRAAVCGRALYEGAFTYADAVAALRGAR